MNKRILIFPLLTVLIIFTEISCSDSKTFYFEWNDINLENLEIYYEGEWISYQQTEKFTFAPLTYGVRINFDYQLIASLINMKVNLIQSANAFTKLPDEYILKDKILSISVKTINDFDNEHLAGSDLTDYFKTLSGGVFIPVNSRLNGTNGINESRIMESQLSEEYNIYLRQNPTIENTQQFEIEVIFESGKSLTKLTKEIEIE